MSQKLAFADSEFSTKRRQTRKEICLSRMQQILPCAEYDRCHERVLSQGGQWPTAYLLETMPRIHCMQPWYKLRTVPWKIALYEIASMRLIANISMNSTCRNGHAICYFVVLSR
jgi:IS5 family transposase